LARPFPGRHDDQGEVSKDTPSNRVIRGHFDLPSLDDYTEIVLFPKSLVDAQAIYVNGQLITDKIKRDEPNQGFPWPSPSSRRAATFTRSWGRNC